MKTTLLAGAALAAVLAAAGGAQAQPFDFLNMGSTVAPPPNGFYLGIDGGWHELNNGGIGSTSSNNAPDGSPYGWKWSPSKGGSWAAFGRVGYQFTPNWRVELEGGYRDSDLRRVMGSADRAQPIGICGVGSTSTCLKTYGHANVVTVMGNAIYDAFPTWIIHPFVGAGVGIARLDIKDFGQFSGGAPGQELGVNDTDTAFAYQAFAGLSYHATHRLNVDLKYTWLDTGADLKWGTTGSGAIQPGTFRGHYNDSTLTIGLRYALGAEPAPPPPVAETKEFVVYFPFDQSILTSDAQAVVQQAAQYAQQGGTAQITVVGHTDTSGSVKYNLRLSERRAKAVADALVGLGVQQGELNVSWVGKTDLAVPTPDGVKEPLNRRTTITIVPSQPAAAPAQ